MGIIIGQHYPFHTLRHAHARALLDLGGNPRHDRIGFRYWDPENIANAPMGTYKETGSLGIFLGK